MEAPSSNRLSKEEPLDLETHAASAAASLASDATESWAEAERLVETLPPYHVRWSLAALVEQRSAEAACRVACLASGSKGCRKNVQDILGRIMAALRVEAQAEAADAERKEWGEWAALARGHTRQPPGPPQPCSSCGGADHTAWGAHPFVEEIYHRTELCWLCAACHKQACDDT